MKRVSGHRLQGWLLAAALHLGLLGWLFLGDAPPRAVAKRPPVRVVLVSRPRPPTPPPRAEQRPLEPRPVPTERPAPRRSQPRRALAAVTTPPTKPPAPRAPSASTQPPPPGTPRFQVSLSATVPGGGVAVPVAPVGSAARSIGVPRWADGAPATSTPPAEPAPRSRPIDASDASRVPELVAQPDPEALRRAYPERARAAGLEANVVLRILVSTEGRVQAVRLIKGAGNGFDEAAQRLVREFRFRAGSRDGKAVPVWIPWTYKFRLNG